LVLSGKVDAQIIIGEHIRVTVVPIRGNQVRLGFEAPHDVSICARNCGADARTLGFTSDLLPVAGIPSLRPS
jgi:hypothetical protein